MQDPTSQPQPSDTLKANRWVLSLYECGAISLAEAERRAERTLVFAAIYSTIPWHAQNAAKDPDDWNTLYASHVLW